jgi:hypothetical protein
MSYENNEIFALGKALAREDTYQLELIEDVSEKTNSIEEVLKDVKYYL